jgi:hypothetical protein
VLTFYDLAEAATIALATCCVAAAIGGGVFVAVAWWLL